MLTSCIGKLGTTTTTSITATVPAACYKVLWSTVWWDMGLDTISLLFVMTRVVGALEAFIFVENHIAFLALLWC